MPLTSGLSERVALEILDSNDDVLSISIMDKKGNILAPLAKESFSETFKRTNEGDKYGGKLALAAPAVANEVKDIAGDVHVIITL
ncbi:MAG: hypothetical protein ACJ71R_08600 [Nitrososphaeraceae archaeon]